MIKTFIETVVAESYESGINDALVECMALLVTKDIRRLGGLLLRNNAEASPSECIDLLNRLVRTEKDNASWETIASYLIDALPRKKPDSSEDYRFPEGGNKPAALSGPRLADFFDALRMVESARLISDALTLVANHPNVYPPADLLVSALKEMKPDEETTFPACPGQRAHGVWYQVPGQVGGGSCTIRSGCFGSKGMCSVHKQIGQRGIDAIPDQPLNRNGVISLPCRTYEPVARLTFNHCAT